MIFFCVWCVWCVGNVDPIIIDLKLKENYLYRIHVLKSFFGKILGK